MGSGGGWRAPRCACTAVAARTATMNAQFLTIRQVNDACDASPDSTTWRFAKSRTRAMHDQPDHLAVRQVEGRCEQVPLRRRSGSPMLRCLPQRAPTMAPRWGRRRMGLCWFARHGRKQGRNTRRHSARPQRCEAFKTSTHCALPFTCRCRPRSSLRASQSSPSSPSAPCPASAAPSRTPSPSGSRSPSAPPR